MKVILILGYCGACRRDELTRMSLNDLQLNTDTVVVNVPRTKTNVSRLFVVTEAPWIALIKKYIELRPVHTSHSRFFLTFRRGRCTTSPMGINKIGEVPKNIAKFLKLANPEKYTGHCFRRSSALHVANQGGDRLTVKKHGGWKSSAVAEGYVESSLKKKVEAAQMFSSHSSQRQPSSTSISASSTSTSGASACTSAAPAVYSPGTSHYHNQEDPVGYSPGIRTNLMETEVIQGVTQNESVVLQQVPPISISASGSAVVTVKIYTHCTMKDN